MSNCVSRRIAWRRTIYWSAAVVALVAGTARVLATDDGLRDDWPAFVQTGNAKEAESIHATILLTGAADDPTWGIFAQRTRIAQAGDQVAKAHDKGLKALTWIEGFGTSHSYIAELRKEGNGGWVKDSRDPTLSRVFHNHWDWQYVGKGGVRRWIGIQNYYGDEDFAIPYTRNHPRYGASPLTYPDGRPARNAASDPRQSAIFDACCAKSVHRQCNVGYGFNDAVNQMQDKIKLQLAYPDLMPVEAIRKGEATSRAPEGRRRPPPNIKLAGLLRFGKDPACPAWVEYSRASVLQAIDTGIDGVWVDNFSPWDSFGSRPIEKAFGEWSVEGFKSFLAQRHSKKALAAIGIDSVESFDVRGYFLARCKLWKGNPESLTDSCWRDPRWREDPVWRRYLVYTRERGTQALSTLYGTIKEVAREQGKPDFLVMGNDIPIFSLGWTRGDLDMVSTELSWTGGLTTGPRGLGPPPFGSYVPVYKLAREHTKRRLVNAWFYSPEQYSRRPNLARVIYYQAIANEAVPMIISGKRALANTEVTREFFGFLHELRSRLPKRRPIEEVGLYYSSSSQLMELLPGGFRNYSDQPHSFSFFGWGKALTQLHVLWRAVPEWKLDSKVLDGLRLLIVPSADVLDEKGASMLHAWVRRGGVLIVAGKSGSRYGEARYFERVRNGSTLSRFGPSMDTAVPVSFKVGQGHVVATPNDPGVPFYSSSDDRRTRLAAIEALIKEALGRPEELTVGPGAPWQIGMTMHLSEDQLFVDLNNTGLEIDSDTLTEADDFEFSILLPEKLSRGPHRIQIISPDRKIKAKLDQVVSGRVRVHVHGLHTYASLVIRGAQ